MTKGKNRIKIVGYDCKELELKMVFDGGISGSRALLRLLRTEKGNKV